MVKKESNPVTEEGNMDKEVLSDGYFTRNAIKYGNNWKIPLCKPLFFLRFFREKWRKSR